ncbi:NAD-dependent epimerase/dehydratase family protein [Terasakiella pusilla]|uniref:NAD-dependent epimerase/dehydratase family protein n=1 Tax=Terasakiella pusilla TaxID=64973 RepID=UPI003AA9DA6B
MKILVTGGAGFIGSMIADAYIEQGHEVVIVDNMFTGRTRNIPKEAVFLNMDIRDEAIFDVFAEHKFDIVNHHAAVTDVRHSVKNPFEYVDVNVSGTIRLLEACRQVYMPKAFVFASSGGCSYGDAQYVPTDEKHPLVPEDPYGTSKVSAEYYIRTYHHLYGLPFNILRYANVYGVRQNPFGESGVIGIFTQGMLRDEPVLIFGKGDQKRDFIYISDVVKGNLLAGETCFNTEFNLGTAVGVDVNTIFRKLAKLTDYDKEPQYVPPRTGEIQLSTLSGAKAEELLGWVPVMDFDKGLSATVDFIRETEV